MKTSINGLLGLIGAITVFTTVSVCFSNCSSEDDFGEMEEMIATMAEKKMTRSGYEGGLGGEETTNLLPSKSEIRSNPTVYAKMAEVWHQTIESAKNGERREFGFYIFYNDGIYTFSNIFKGPIVGPNEKGTITYPGTSNQNVCGAFHTHTPLINCNSDMERNAGPSDEDKQTSHARQMPCFVYDYVSSPVKAAMSPDAPGQIYDYGVERRTL